VGTRAYARLRVTVEVPCGTYGDDAAFAQVKKQATREGMAKLAHLFQKDGIKIVGDDAVSVILVEEKS